MSLGKLFTTIFVSLFLSGNVFAEGSKFDRFATDVETTAQLRDDVGLTPASIPFIMATPGTIGKLQLDHNTEILNADRTILITDKPIQFLDANGADRNVTLPAEASSIDLVFTLYNDSDGAGEDLVIRDDTPTTLITIGPGQGTRVSCDGTSWKVLDDKGTRYDRVAKSTIFPQENDVTTPTLAFGDGDTGFYEEADNILKIVTEHTARARIDSSWAIKGAGANHPGIRYVNPTATLPSIVPNNSDADTGIGHAAADQLSLIAGDVEGIRISEATTIEIEIQGREVLNDNTFSFTTEADITDPLPTSVILLSGDNDSENDTIDLQNGETAGQVLYLIASANIDADDTCTINYGDTTCTNCPVTVFNKVGENAHLIWSGSTWVVISLQNAL